MPKKMAATSIWELKKKKTANYGGSTKAFWQLWIFFFLTLQNIKINPARYKKRSAGTLITRIECEKR